MEIERLGPYEIVGILGRGGMGAVYKAVHRETREVAAVKLLSADLAGEEGFRGRFEAEIETLRKLRHPNIVRLFGFGEQEGLLFYAMELVEGNSLEEELRRGRRFDWREVTRIGIEMCRALRHAHDRGVIHRDIKPGNLLLAADGSVKLSDFGIARLFGYSRLTSVGNVLGTAEYMAPEQAAGQPVDARADIYSLGALMYALLARRPLFRGKSLPEMLHKQRYEQPEPIRKLVADIPEEFERILSQVLEKEPNRRIPNADILARRLEAMLQALSVNPETLAANVDWFHSDKPAPEEPDDAVLLPGDIAATLDFGGAVEEKKTLEKHGREPVADSASLLEIVRPERVVAAVPSASVPPPLATALPGDTPSPSRFITVSEDELGDVDEEEEERPPMFSWQTGALVVALVLVALSVWWFLQPPTADTLAARIDAKVADDSIDQAEGDIHDFLIRYSGDRRAKTYRKYQQRLDLDDLQRRFDLASRGLTGKKDFSPIGLAYSEAMHYMQLDPEAGMAKLQAIVDLYGQDHEPDPNAMCLILAQQQLAQLRDEVAKRSAAQLSLLQERLNVADAVRTSEPEQAKTMYRAIIELYSNKPWAADAVRRARQGLKPPPGRRPQDR
jgi:serine/threonine-protein kinase